MNAFDPRITPARADLAAAALKGKIDVPRYAEGEPRTVVCGVAALRSAPDRASGLGTELLFGERFTVYDEKDGWAWGQAESDSYVGYTGCENLAAPAGPSTHRIIALATPLLTAPDVKSAASGMLPMNAKIAASDAEGRFAKMGAHYIASRHLAPLASSVPDWVAVAERFLGVPYLWGGKTAAGLDCTGLIQTALEAGGIAAPRDTDMIESGLGDLLPLGANLRGLQRGDLIFWNGHAGVMQNETDLLHANAFHMEVASEPLSAAASRIAAAEGAIRAVKRIRAA